MYRLSNYQQALIISCIARGVSVRDTAELIGLTPNTVIRNVLWIGEGLQQFHNETVRDLKSKRLQFDELWNFIYAKDKNLPPEYVDNPEFGDCYTWVAIDPDTNLIVSWRIGKRTIEDCAPFVEDVRSRVLGTPQITSDKLSLYAVSLAETFGTEVNYATVRKITGDSDLTPDGQIEQPKFKGERKAKVIGKPDPEHIKTSSIESFNLRIRMRIRRYARRTNAFSKRIQYQRAAFALTMAHHNFCRICPPIRVTPAMQSGCAKTVWSVMELVRHIPERKTRWTNHTAARPSRHKAGISLNYDFLKLLLNIVLSK